MLDQNNIVKNKLDNRISLRKSQLDDAFFEKRKLKKSVQTCEIDPFQLNIRSEIANHYAKISIEVLLKM